MEHLSEPTASRQCYLAAILSLETERGRARPSEIASRIRVSRPSVTAALRGLADQGFAHYEPYGTVELTPRGRQIAETVLSRRRVIWEYLVRTLEIPEESAYEAACLMESSVPETVIDRFAAQLATRG